MSHWNRFRQVGGEALGARRARLWGASAGLLLFGTFFGCGDDGLQAGNVGAGGGNSTGGTSSSASGGTTSSAGGQATGGKSGGSGVAGASAGGAASGAGGSASTSGGGAGLGGSDAQGGTPAEGGEAAGGSELGGNAGATSGGATPSGGTAGSGEPATGGEVGTSGSGGESGGSVDDFGIKQLYPSAPSGAAWSSAHWAGGEPYEIDGRTDDNDPLGISGMRGEGTLEVTGDGELVMGGGQPRIYVYENEAGPWRDLEITAYYQRVEEDPTQAYAGLVIGTRSGAEGHTEDTPCDAHTYYARLRHDGAIDFEKELKHPASSTRERVDPETVWPPDGELPFDTWIGFKFVIYNLGTLDAVKFESYRDLTQGENGGDWQLMSETLDEGGWFVESDCEQHSPNGDGESDMVVTDGGVVMIRNTDVIEARYRWVTIREIAPPL